MPLKRFGSNSDFAPDALAVFENLGLAIYIAQLFVNPSDSLTTGTTVRLAAAAPAASPSPGAAKK